MAAPWAATAPGDRLGSAASAASSLSSKEYLVNENRSLRWLIWSGPLFAAVFLVVGFVIEGNAPGEKASAAEVMKYFNAHHGRSLVSVFLGPLGALLLVLFAASVRDRTERLGASQAGVRVMLGGAILWGAGLLLSSGIELALVSSSDHDQSQVAQTVNVISNADWVPFIGGIAVFLIGAGLAVLTSRALPVWVGWVAIVGGVASLAGPGGFVGFFLAPIWILVAGIMLAVRREPAV